MSELILISGSPGSGKTTLATLLAAEMGYEFVNGDEYLEGVWQNHRQDPDYDREQTGTMTLFRHLRSRLENGENLVTDVVLVEGKNETMLADLLQDHNVHWLHCIAEKPLERYRKRETLQDGSMPDWFKDHFQYLTDYNHKMRQPLRIEQVPVIVSTEKGYSPSLSELLKIVQPKSVEG